MRAVSIYTATSIRGRWGKNGHVGYALEYYAEGHKQPDVLFDYEPVDARGMRPDALHRVGVPVPGAER